MTDLAPFRAETRAWLEENCPPGMRTYMPENEQVAGGKNDTFSCNVTGAGMMNTKISFKPSAIM